MNSALSLDSSHSQSSESQSPADHMELDSVTEEPLHDLLKPEKLCSDGRSVYSLSSSTRPRLNHHLQLDECPDSDEENVPRRNEVRRALVLQDHTNKLRFYEISIPRPTPTLTEPLKRRKCTKKGSKRKKNRKYSKSCCTNSRYSFYSDDDDIDNEDSEDDYLGSGPDAGKEQWQIDARRESIQQKLGMGLESLLTRAEEEDIHERAELHSLTICPDVEYYVLPEDDPEPYMEDTKSSVVQQHRRRKRRNYLNCKCYVTEHSKDDLYDNTKMLSIGTKLLRPTSKLVELVAQAIEGSPDGLLQVQQIYTVLQNKFPYFRYMDKSAISSWRSSIRHALYQKWFVKIRFKTDTINCKGCYWKISHHYQQMEKTDGKKTQKPSNDQIGNPQDYDLDPNTHDTVLALLTQEEEEEGKNQQSNLQEVIRIAKEYGISISDCISEADYKMGKIAMQTQGRDADPILSNCIADQKLGSDEEFDTCTPTVNKTSESSSSNSGERQPTFVNNYNSPFMSPLINEATKKELIGIDPKTQMDRSPFGSWIQEWENHYYQDSPFFTNTVPVVEGDGIMGCMKDEDYPQSVMVIVASSSDNDCTNDTIANTSPDEEQPYDEHW